MLYSNWSEACGLPPEQGDILEDPSARKYPALQPDSHAVRATGSSVVVALVAVWWHVERVAPAPSEAAATVQTCPEACMGGRMDAYTPQTTRNSK